MNLENTKAQMRKGILEYCILQILSKKPSYATDIIQEMKTAQMIVVEGTLYPLLTRLKNDGYLSYRWEESVQGPPRKYYELTENDIIVTVLTDSMELYGSRLEEMRAKMGPYTAARA